MNYFFKICRLFQSVLLYDQNPTLNSGNYGLISTFNKSTYCFGSACGYHFIPFFVELHLAETLFVELCFDMFWQSKVFHWLRLVSLRNSLTNKLRPNFFIFFCQNFMWRTIVFVVGWNCIQWTSFVEVWLLRTKTKQTILQIFLFYLAWLSDS